VTVPSAPVAGGPLVIDPTDRPVVDAAIMTQQPGLALTTTETLLTCAARAKDSFARLRQSSLRKIRGDQSG
jgi:hypothetical protein